jgi:hypothetical protein
VAEHAGPVPPADPADQVAGGQLAAADEAGDAALGNVQAASECPPVEEVVFLLP